MKLASIKDMGKFKLRLITPTVSYMSVIIQYFMGSIVEEKYHKFITKGKYIGAL